MIIHILRNYQYSSEYKRNLNFEANEHLALTFIDENI